MMLLPLLLLLLLKVRDTMGLPSLVPTNSSLTWEPCTRGSRAWKIARRALVWFKICEVICFAHGTFVPSLAQAPLRARCPSGIRVGLSIVFSHTSTGRGPPLVFVLPTALFLYDLWLSNTTVNMVRLKFFRSNSLRRSQGSRR